MKTKSFQEAKILFETHQPELSKIAHDIAIEQCLAEGTTNAVKVRRQLMDEGYKPKRWFFVGGVLAGKDFAKCGMSRAIKLCHKRPIFEFRLKDEDENVS